LPPKSAAARLRRGDAGEIVEGVVREHRVVQQSGDDGRPPALRRQRLEVRDAGVAALCQHEDAAPGFAQRAYQRVELHGVGKPRRHRRSAFAIVLRRGRAGKTDGAGSHRLQHQPPHRGDLLRRRRARGRVVAHDIGAK
jgi:hypothetical protein